MELTERLIKNEGNKQEGNINREDLKKLEKHPIVSFKGSDERENIIIPVIVNISIKAVGNVDIVNMTTDIKFTLAIFCNVEGLDETTQEYVKEHISMFLDDVEMDLEKARRKIRKDVITIIYRGEGQNYFQLKRKYLRYLPFDIHWMNIKFMMADIEHEEKKQVFRFDCLVCSDRRSMVQYRPHYDRIPEWNIAISETTVKLLKETKKDHSGSEIHYNPEIVIRMLLYREPEYLIYMVMVPLLILNLCTLAVYGLSAESYSDKLSILVTLLLAMFAFIPTIRDNIPKVPFVTVLDGQVFFSITLIFIGLMETVINGLFTGEGEGLIVKYVFVSISIFVILACTCMNGLFWYPYKKRCLNYHKEAKEIMEKYKTKAAYSSNIWSGYRQDLEQKEEEHEYGLFYLWDLGGTPKYV